MSIIAVGPSRYWGIQNEAELAKLTGRWGWILASGVAFIVFGILAAGTAGLTTIVSMIFFGWLMAFAGIVQIVEALIHRERGRFILEMVSGVLYLVAGYMLITSPGLSAVMLTLLLAPLFLILGAARTISAVALRDSQWGWQALSGVITLWLGLFIWNQWPSSSFWLIGTFIGIEFMFEGIALGSFALALKNKGRKTPAAA